MQITGRPCYQTGEGDFIIVLKLHRQRGHDVTCLLRGLTYFLYFGETVGRTKKETWQGQTSPDISLIEQKTAGLHNYHP